MRGFYGYAPYSYGYSPYVGQQAPPPGQPHLVPYEQGATNDGWPRGYSPSQKPRGPLIPGTSVSDPTRSTLDGSLATMKSDDVQRYLISCLKNLDDSGAAYFDSVLKLLYIAIMEAARFGYTTNDLQKLVSGLVAASGYQRLNAEQTARRKAALR